MTRALALHATKNTGGKSDATGAFVPEAVHFAKHHACYRVGFDNTLGSTARRAFVEDTIRKHRDLEVVALFCHGLRRSMQTGHDMPTIARLASAIADASGPRVIVALYACSTGATETGFAATLRDELAERGKAGHVDSHTNAAHTTRNPFVRRFVMGEREGDWVVEPGSREWKAWRASLTGDMRFRFCLMTVEMVRAELR